jgi:hypothetical protein
MQVLERREREYKLFFRQLLHSLCPRTVVGTHPIPGPVAAAVFFITP